ncbi:MAG: VWA domain-containing protein [Kiritimatiellae bacterium]|nr:VWA domain-containing protein [Kiritimatiellia bacterium]
MFRFADPYYLFLLIPLCAAGWAMLARRRKAAVLFAPTHRLPTSPLTWRTAAIAMTPLLFLAGAGLTIFALARPQTVLSKTAHQSDAIAIQMVVDVSGSMEALDFSTRDTTRTRLDVVKETFAQFIEKRTDDLIGLVTFGGYTASRVPLTIDHSALLHVLKGVQIPKPSLDANGQLANQEELLTAIGDALAMACARLEKAEIKSKIIVLLSDGVSNTGLIKPDEATKAAKALGIKVYTIGVGSNGRAPFMVRDPFGRNVIQYAEVQIDEDTLRRIASTTGGQYFNVKDPKGLLRAFGDIDKLEKTNIRKEVFNQYTELFPHCLWPGLLALVLAVSMNMGVRKEII